MRGIQPDGPRCRDIRLAAGLTQQQLAARAGVSERTVRNAEAGRRVRYDFLLYLAQSLEVGVRVLTPTVDEICAAERESANIKRVCEAIEQFVVHRDLSGCRALMTPQVRCFVHGPDAIPFTGEFRTLGGVQKLMDVSEESVIHLSPVNITEIRASGNLVILEGIDHLQAATTGKSTTSWWQHIYEFEKGRVVRMDEHFDTQSQLRIFT